MVTLHQGCLGGGFRLGLAGMGTSLLGFLGQPAELEGRRAVTMPLRFADGAVSLGPLALGRTAPLYEKAESK